MNTKLLLLSIIILIGCGLRKDQDSSNQLEEYEIESGILPIYECNSSYLLELIQLLNDSSMNRYGCENISRLTLSHLIFPDSTEQIRLRPMLYKSVKQYNYVDKLRDLDFIVMRVQNVDILIKNNFFKNSPFNLNSKFIGNHEFTLNYTDFERCLNKNGVILLVDFYYSKDSNSVRLANYAELVYD